MLDSRKLGMWTWVLVFLAGCAAPAKVEHATSQVWHGGAAGSGGGKNYRVTVSKPSKLQIEFDQVWVGDREKGWLPDFRVLYEGLPNGSRNHIASAGVAQFEIEFAESFPGSPNNSRGEGRPIAVKPFDNAPNDLPETFQQGAVLYFHIGNNASTWVVSDFEVLEPLYYP